MRMHSNCYILFSEEQVRSEHDASELNILGHLGTIRTFFGQFGRLFYEFGALLRVWSTVSYSLSTIFTHYRLITKCVMDEWIDGPTD